MAAPELEHSLIQTALARGLLTPAQLAQAQAEQQARAARGQPADLLQLLGQGLPPAQVEELRRVHAELTAGGAFSSTAPTLPGGGAFSATAPTLPGGAPLPEAAPSSPGGLGARTTLVPPPQAGLEGPGLGSGAGGAESRRAGRPSALPGPGDQVGSYRIEAELARGGMGVVYRARHVELEREVALKLVLGDASAAAEQRFQVEAEASAQLQHPGIAHVYDAGRDDHGRAFLAMEFVPGESLKARLQRGGRLEPREAVELTLELARALEHAHARGVLHRDLKPENVLLGDGGRPKLTDFGLARRMDRAERLTKTGEIMGTPAYMPPEQASGEKHRVDERADVYGLGATLYHLLTGEPPFQGASVMNILSKLLKDPPRPPRELAPEVPAGLETICLRCLAKEPAERYPSMSALAEDLERALAGERVIARRSASGPWAWVGVLLVASGALALVHLSSRPAPEVQLQTAESLAVEGEAASSSPGEAAEPELAYASAERVLEGPGWLEPAELELHHAWAIRPVAEGLRLCASGASSPELLLPVRLGPGPFAIELEARIDLLEAWPGRGHALALQLERLVDGQAQEALRFEARAAEVGPENGTALQGTRTVLSWGSVWGTQGRGHVTGDPGTAGSVLRRGQALRMRVTYDPRRLALSFLGQLGEGTPRRWELGLSDPVPPGVYRLRLGLGLDESRRSRVHFADVRLSRLSLRGFMSEAAQAGLVALGGRTCRTAWRDRQAGSDALLQAQQNPEIGVDPDVLGAMTYTVALANLTDDPQGTPLIGLLRQTTEGQWFGRRWLNDVCAYSREELQALAEAVAEERGWSPKSALARGLDVVNARQRPGKKDWGEALVAFLVAGEEDVARRHPLELGRAWLMTGHFPEALAVLEPLERAETGASNGRAGYAAYRLRDFQRAAELWSGEGALGRDFTKQYAELATGCRLLLTPGAR